MGSVLLEQVKKMGIEVTPEMRKMSTKDLWAHIGGYKLMTKPTAHINNKDVQELKKMLKTARTIEGKANGTVHAKRAKRMTNSIQKLLIDIRTEDVLL